MKHVAKTLGMIVVSLVVATSLATAAVGLPYATGFESDTPGSAPDNAAWTPTGGVAAVVQSGSAIEGSQRCYIATNQLALDLSAGDNTNVWCLVHVKPGLFTDAPAEASVAGAMAAFYVDTTRTLKCYSSNQWVSVLTAVPTNDAWLTVAVHLDYNNSSWDIYASTSGVYGATMTKLNTTEPLKASIGVGTEFTSVTIDSELPGNIDFVAASDGAFVVSAGTPTNLSFVVQSNQSLLAVMEFYRYDAVENTLGGQLGEDLKGQVGNGRKIYVQGTNGWNEYLLSGDAWVPQPPAQPIGDIHITDAMTVWVDRSGAPYNAAGFAAYDEDELVPPANNPPIYGTDRDMRGWNALAWPSAVTRGQFAGWGTFPLNSGDQMYIVKDVGAGALLNYNSSVGNWREGRSASAETLAEGQTFYYYYGTTGVSQWDVSGLPQ